MDELTDMWTESKTDFDAALDFPEWWERDVEAMVRKDVNHPSVVLYSIGNEIPEVGKPHGARLVAAAGGEGALARRHPVRHQRHQRDARRDRRGHGPRQEQAGINTMLTDMGAFMDELPTVRAGRDPDGGVLRRARRGGHELHGRPATRSTGSCSRAG